MRKITLQFLLSILPTFVGFANETQNNVFAPNSNLSYCTPNFSNNMDYIKDVTTSGGITNLNNTNTGSGTNGSGYSNYTSQQLVITQGTNVSFNVNLVAIDGNYLSIWIDKNNDGVFSHPGERVFNSLIQSTSHSGILNTNTLAAGTYRLRIMSHYGIASVDPCVSTLFGEAEDYTIVVQGSNTCSGTPNAGTITVNPVTANPGSTYNVTSTNYDDKNGLTFQWEKYNEATSDWEDYGTPSSVYQGLNSEIAPADVDTEVKYRLKVTCTNSNETSYSNEATFTTSLIYCVPSYNLSDDYTSLFQTTNGTTNANYSATGQIGNGYSDFSNDTSQLITQTAGQSVNFTHTYVEGEFGLPGNTISIWVDWNNNGTFEDTEKVYSQFSETSSTQTGSFTITENTIEGNYRLRVRSRYGDNPIEACSNYGYGQALDFTLVVVAASFSDCPEPLNAGTISVTPDSTGYDIGDTITYTWEKSEDNGATWVVVGTENSSTYTDLIGEVAPDSGVVEYRLTISCDDNTAIATGTFTTTVNVATFDLFGFSYHPNPVNDILHFSSNSKIEKVTISNILGQQISANLNSDNTILDMSNLPSGNYFVKVTIEGVSN